MLVAATRQAQLWRRGITAARVGGTTPFLAPRTISTPALRKAIDFKPFSRTPNDAEGLNLLIEELGRQPARPLTIRELMETTRESKGGERAILQSAHFIQRELPVRLAQLLKEMQSLPFIVGINPYIKTIYNLYRNSFEELVRFPPIENLEQEKEYTATLERLVEEHKDVIPTMSKGMIECKKYINPKTVKEFLDRKIRDRISIRVLAEQHIALHREESNGYAGIINRNLNPSQLILDVAKTAQELCDLNYGIYPDIMIQGATDATFPYIPVHMEYIIFELLKNSMRATVEFAEANDEKAIPPVVVTIGKGTRDITMRFSDRGGGVPHDELDSIWEYSYSTMNENRKSKKKHAAEAKDTEGESIFAAQVRNDLNAGVGGPMAGLGYGLPMSRVYAQFFGGNLDLVSLYGHGCDVFLRLNHLGDQMEAAEI